MADRKKVMANITSMVELADGIFSMWLKFGEQDAVAAEAKPGQFVSLYCKEGSRLLPRPISICDIDKENNMLRLVYRVAGEGTKEFSTYQAGDSIAVIGPLGNGFPIQGEHPVLIGGGIGIPPMLALAKSFAKPVTIVLGYRDADMFLKEEFEPYGTVLVSTEDGSVGTKGNVIDAIKEHAVEGDILMACGPSPMLRGVKAYAAEKKLPAKISMEERMACGIGACLACVCQSVEKDHHTNVNNKRICKDGPVFDAEEVDLG